MTQKRSLGPHNSNLASGADHLNVSEDQNLRPESPNTEPVIDNPLHEVSGNFRDHS